MNRDLSGSCQCGAITFTGDTQPEDPMDMLSAAQACREAR
jgi:hypothetical protein